jgi:hypothetical protein
VPGRVTACKHCGRAVVVNAAASEPVDEAQELIRRGAAAGCPACGQLVEVRERVGARTFVPHYAAGPGRKICPGSGKPVDAAPAAEGSAAVRGPAGKDLSAYRTRDSLRVVSCRKGCPPQMEQLTLEYLDKSDRVRLQIDALRDVLGPDFRMRDYPEPLHRPHLAVWASAAACVVGRRHERGGYEALSDADVAQAVDDLTQHPELFFR